MIEVETEEFYRQLHAAETRLNCAIMPVIVSEWDDQIGYQSEWRSTDFRRLLFGKSQCGDCHGGGRNKKYWISDTFYLSSTDVPSAAGEPQPTCDSRKP